MGDVPERRPKRGESVDEIVRREAPGYRVKRPARRDDTAQRARPDASVPSLDAMRRKAGGGPGTDRARKPMPRLRARDTEVRILEPEAPRSDPRTRGVGPKQVIVSRSKGRIVSRQG